MITGATKLCSIGKFYEDTGRDTLHTRHNKRWAMVQESLSLRFLNNKVTNQLGHPRLCFSLFKTYHILTY